MRSPGRRPRSPSCLDDGSLSVELVLLMPALFLIVVAIVAFGRVSQARQQVAAAATAGAEAAAVGRSPSSAVAAARLDAGAEVADHLHSCPQPSIGVDTSHFYPGGFVTITVTCRVALEDLSLPGVPGSTTVSASSTAPVDPYRVVG